MVRSSHGVLAITAAIAWSCNRPTPPTLPPTNAPSETTVETTLAEGGADGQELLAPGRGSSAPLPPPTAVDDEVRGAEFIRVLGERIGPRWTSFLADLGVRLGPGEPINGLSLSSVVDIVIDAEGTLVRADVVSASGVGVFDDAAREVVRESVRELIPPETLIGDDRVARVRWVFHRDPKQAGSRDARAIVARWTVAEAVPRLVERGEQSLAAERLAAALGQSNEVSESLLQLLDYLAVGFVCKSLSASDPDVALAAMHATGELGIARCLPNLKAASQHPAIHRGVALEALAAFPRERRDQSFVVASAEEIVADLETSESLATTAARLVIRLGGRAEQKRLAQRAKKPLASGDPRTLRRSLVIAGVIPIVGIRSAAASQLGDRGNHEAAVRALARLASVGDRKALSILRRHLTMQDSPRRVESMVALVGPLFTARLPKSLARIIAAQVRSPDERVRAAAARMLARGNPRALLELVDEANRSPLVALEVVRGLASWQTGASTRALIGLLASKELRVRQLAARALEPRSRKPTSSARAALVAGATTDRELALMTLQWEDSRILVGLARAGKPSAAVAVRALIERNEPSAAELAALVLARREGAEPLAVSVSWLRKRNRARLKR